MDAKNLLDQYFETAFTAPDGIKRLRELILTLAMRGQLIPQDPADQPARELLREIEAEKQELIKAGKLKKSKPLPPIKPEEIPYELPESWEWVRLGDVGTWQSGSTPSRSNSSFYGGNIPWVKSGEVKQGRIFDTEEKITTEALAKCSLNLNPAGSILIAMYGANIGEVGILEIEATTNQAICACQTFSVIDNVFLSKLLDSLKQNFISQGAGAAQPNISRIKIVNTIIPLPPLAEQKRLVEKIDRLMALCDQLEQLGAVREQKRILIHTSAREKLLKASDQETFGQAWDFIQENFGELYAVKENVASLRQTILQLAVMGKLVPQDPNDPPASELLKEIEAEKQRLIKEGKLKKQKPLPEITAAEIPYELPNGWEWVRLVKITSILGDGIHGTPQYDDCGNYSFINGNNLINGLIEIKENTKKVAHSSPKCTRA
ncbi:MAG: restriction endonuclease subunit S [Cyanobacteria bacterium RI_101]|nr:restriction endonuclease subunit S [Cyanobacteria bacterium RI_101]